MKGKYIMGLRFTREFKRIIEELTEAILKIDNFYQFFEMSKQEWLALTEEEQKEVAKTLADDVFYALGMDPKVEICGGIIEFLKENNIIQVSSKECILGIIEL
jgi:carbamate kinase